MRIGFIGVGSMGSAMIPHLIKAGHEVSAWNRNPVAVEALKGVAALSSPHEAFANEVVMTMLSDDDAVRSVVIKSGALTAAAPGCVHVVTATISPALAEELGTLHRNAGVGYVAAPVMGIPAVAAQAQLNILAAGDSEAIAVVQPLFDVLGRKTWSLGDDPVRANIAKIAANMMITLAIEAMGEATALVEQYGLDAASFLDVMTNTAFGCTAYQRYGNSITTDTYEPGFKLTLGLKDVRLALEAAQAKTAPLPAAEVVRETMEAAVEAGLGDEDWSALAKVTKQRAGPK